MNNDTCADVSVSAERPDLPSSLISPQTVFNAIKAGYRLFDGAGDYGNEKEAGEGIKRAIDQGLVKREDICGCLSQSYLI